MAIGADLSCTVSAINLSMDELISDEKQNANTILLVKHLESIGANSLCTSRLQPESTTELPYT